MRDIVFDARYLVMGLGDVYLGAPVATPLDPRHRLVTTKYNPARTWTPPNVVGIGGAYLCIYGMEGPGGYQLFGRTLQVWNTWQQTQAFTDDKPWLLRFFDQIRFFPVSHAELSEWRRDFPLGRRDVRIETETFSLAAYRRFLDTNAAAIETFQIKRQAAFEAEREAWVRGREFSRVEELLQEPAAVTTTITIPAGSEVLEAPLGGNVWKVNVLPGDRVARGTVIAVIEAMKMECDVPAPQAGIVRAVYVQPRQAINPGAPIIALEPQGMKYDSRCAGRVSNQSNKCCRKRRPDQGCGYRGTGTGASCRVRSRAARGFHPPRRRGRCAPAGARGGRARGRRGAPAAGRSALRGQGQH